MELNKEQLRAYRDLRRERDDLGRKIAELEAAMYGPRAQRLDGMPHGGQTGNGLEGQLNRKDELLDLYREKEAELGRRLLDIERAIDQLASRERRLIRLHYIDGLTWEQVCVEMSYSWTQVHRDHREALAKLREET